jgi:hypothetical protein
LYEDEECEAVGESGEVVLSLEFLRWWNIAYYSFGERICLMLPRHTCSVCEEVDADAFCCR